MRLNSSNSDQDSLLSLRVKERVDQTEPKVPDISTNTLRRNIESYGPDEVSLPDFDTAGNEPATGRHTHRRKRSRARTHLARELSVPLPPAEDYDAELEAEASTQSARQNRKKIALGIARPVFQVILVLLCVYVGFLIFGAIETRYVYDSNGNVVPEVLSVSDLQTLAEYETLSSYYLRARVLYEQTLRIDYHLSEAPDDSLIVAMDYTAMLEDVAKLTTDIAAGVDTAGVKYSPLYNQLLSWVKTDIAVYLQEMSSAITKNSADSAGKALAWRDAMYNDFSKISENMYYLGSSTKGCANLDVYDWSPERYSKGLTKGG